ncbi:hypothetical protein D3C78_1159270 [compost metagenome]
MLDIVQPCLGNVLEESGIQDPARQGDLRDGHGAPALFTILARDAHITADPDDLVDPGLAVRADITIVVGAYGLGHQRTDIATQHVQARTAPKALGRGIEKHHVVQVINDHHRIHCLLQGLHEKVLRIPGTCRPDSGVHCCHLFKPPLTRIPDCRWGAIRTLGTGRSP